MATSSPTRRLGSAAAWPLVARAQQDGRVRRIGVLTGNDENDPGMKSLLSVSPVLVGSGDQLAETRAWFVSAIDQTIADILEMENNR